MSDDWNPRRCSLPSQFDSIGSQGCKHPRKSGEVRDGRFISVDLKVPPWLVPFMGPIDRSKCIQFNPTMQKFPTPCEPNPWNLDGKARHRRRRIPADVAMVLAEPTETGENAITVLLIPSSRVQLVNWSPIQNNVLWRGLRLIRAHEEDDLIIEAGFLNRLAIHLGPTRDTRCEIPQHRSRRKLGIEG